jgi:hypothetical protein
VEVVFGAIFIAVVLFFLVGSGPPKRKRKAATIGKVAVGAIIAGTALAAALAVISWRDIQAWLQPRMSSGDLAKIILDGVESGNYAKGSLAALRAEVRDGQSGAIKHKRTWEGRLDDDLMRRFGDKNEITVVG